MPMEDFSPAPAARDFMHLFTDREAAFAASLFTRLERETRDDNGGVRRASFGSGEQVAWNMFAEVGSSLGLDVAVDRGGNLHLRLPGQDPDLPGWLTGSHLDSVPNGGNFDGAAGIVAGLAVVAAYRHARVRPRRSMTVLGIRGEEASSWYGGKHQSHFGSRAALGLLGQDELNTAVNLASGKALAADLQAVNGLALASDRIGTSLRPENYKGFVELHIEQGPVLEHLGIPVGIVSGIRGSARLREGSCKGEYTHSGAVPREYRRDAVLAAAELCHCIELEWGRRLQEGKDLVCTVGKLYTDPASHSVSKVPGEVRFSIDFRSLDSKLLEEMVDRTRSVAAEIGQRRNVAFEADAFDFSLGTEMHADIADLMTRCAIELNIRTTRIASGAGHDAQEFSRAGFPTAMIFVRNSFGSHNPRESMEMNDFMEGVRLLACLTAQ
jgi:N-carbamoyl-L-amino-acid hydrolase